MTFNPGRCAGTLAVGAAAILGLADLAAQVTFSARVDIVRLDVLVTLGGRPLAGLTAKDFEVRDSGVPQEIDFVSVDEAPLNVLLAMDVSASVAGARLDELKRAGRAVVSAMRGEDRAGLLAFHHALLAPVPPTRDRAAVAAALDGLAAGGVGTALRDAAHAGLVLLPPDESRPVLVLFSDGVDTTSWLRAEDVFEVARRSGAVVYGVVGAGERRNDFLEDLAELTAGRVHQVRPGASLERVFLDILAEFRNRYVIGFRPRGVPSGGWHELSVRLKDRSGNVRARRGYQAGPAGAPAARPAGSGAPTGG